MEKECVLTKEEKRKERRSFLMWLGCCLLFILITRAWVGIRGQVVGYSMAPTYQEGDCFLLREDWAIWDYDRGDVVVVDSKALDQKIIKRLIGLPGDLIELKSVEVEGIYLEEVWLNGELLEEPYINSADIRKTAETTRFEVPEGAIFVMGDNRRHSLDSRGMTEPYIPFEEVMGRAILTLPEGICQLGSFNFKK